MIGSIRTSSASAPRACLATLSASSNTSSLAAIPPPTAIPSVRRGRNDYRIVNKSFWSRVMAKQSVAEIFESMEYGPAPEEQTRVRAWLADHKSGFGHFINGEWTAVSRNKIEAKNPADGE